jgi:hypothetical protein
VLKIIIVVIIMVMWQHPCPFYQSFHTSSQLRKHIPDTGAYIPRSCDLLAALCFSTVELRQCKITNELSVTRAAQATQKAPGLDRIITFEPSDFRHGIKVGSRPWQGNAFVRLMIHPHTQKATREILLQKPGQPFSEYSLVKAYRVIGLPNY